MATLQYWLKALGVGLLVLAGMVGIGGGVALLIVKWPLVMGALLVLAGATFIGAIWCDEAYYR